MAKRSSGALGLGDKPMTLLEAQKLAQISANETGTTVLVYRSELSGNEDYDVAFTIPTFGTQVDEPFEPVEIE